MNVNVNVRVARQARTEVEVDARGLDWGKGAKRTTTRMVRGRCGAVRCGGG